MLGAGIREQRMLEILRNKDSDLAHRLPPGRDRNETLFYFRRVLVNHTEATMPLIGINLPWQGPQIQHIYRTFPRLYIR